MKAFDEVVQRALPRSQLPDERVGVEPDEFALVVEVNAASLGLPLVRRVVEQLRRDRLIP